MDLDLNFLPSLTTSSAKLSRDRITVVVNGDYPSWIRVNKICSHDNDTVTHLLDLRKLV